MWSLDLHACQASWKLLVVESLDLKLVEFFQAFDLLSLWTYMFVESLDLMLVMLLVGF